MKYENYQNLLSENFQFLVVKFSVYLNRHVFVMSYITHMQPEKQVNKFNKKSLLSSLLPRSTQDTTSVLSGSIGQQTTSAYLQTNNVAPDQPDTLNMRPSFRTKDQDNVIMVGEPVANTSITPARQQSKTESQSMSNKTGFTLSHNSYTKLRKIRTVKNRQTNKLFTALMILYML